ncbi:hypothetical protein I4U23_016656 [Adineta vaga]|nr:hypothetical protein I4U23_016656 [Adineta vaga]
MASWLYITQIFLSYVAPIIFIISLIGCIMNIIIFSTVDMYRCQSCTFFLLISAIVRCIHILNTGLSRGLAIIFHIDLTLVSLFWCKVRYYIINTCLGIAMTCECLATINQFLVTSKEVKLRRLSNIKLTHRISVGFIIFWLLQNIPCLIFVDLNSNVCAIYNQFWQIYFNYINNWFLFTIVPLILCVLFGILTYRNMHNLTNLNQLQGADRQLTYMICGQVMATIIPIIPTAFFLLYSSSAISINETAGEKGIDYFIFNIVNTLIGLLYGATFYIFIIVSSTFRQQVKRCFCKNRNRVTPVNINNER